MINIGITSSSLLQGKLLSAYIGSGMLFSVYYSYMLLGILFCTPLLLVPYHGNVNACQYTFGMDCLTSVLCVGITLVKHLELVLLVI